MQFRIDQTTVCASSLELVSLPGQILEWTLKLFDNPECCRPDENRDSGLSDLTCSEQKQKLFVKIPRQQ